MGGTKDVLVTLQTLLRARAPPSSREILQAGDDSLDYQLGSLCSSALAGLHRRSSSRSGYVVSHQASLRRTSQPRFPQLRPAVCRTRSNPCASNRPTVPTYAALWSTRSPSGSTG